MKSDDFLSEKMCNDIKSKIESDAMQGENRSGKSLLNMTMSDKMNLNVDTRPMTTALWCQQQNCAKDIGEVGGRVWRESNKRWHTFCCVSFLFEWVHIRSPLECIIYKSHREKIVACLYICDANSIREIFFISQTISHKHR